MSGIDYKKLAKKAEKDGNLKKAADYYSRLGIEGVEKAYALYEQILSETDDQSVINDIKARLKKSPEFSGLVPLAKMAKERSLERFVGVRTILAGASILTLIGALFFVSSNLTGYAVGGLTNDNLSFIGTLLFIAGLAFAFVFFKSKGKK